MVYGKNQIIRRSLAMETSETALNKQEKLEWSAPKLQLLNVTLDTQFGSGSGADGLTGNIVEEPTEEPTPIP